jgi:peptidoglycan hydrolase-like protein with peptidoglycan-binding domain
VQRALGAATTGMFDAGTVAAVKRFQRRHTLLVTGAMNVPTWRALLAVTR